MNRTMLKSKIHRATITMADLNYEGSIAIDTDLLTAADILAFEKVAVWNITNGNRFETYAIEERAGSGMICVNGAAARLVSPGDKIIIASWVDLNEEEVKAHEPKLVFVDDRNVPLAPKASNKTSLKSV
ncbi:MAG: aspartate 1-decarboxylase [Deltaproteobacteria bacterium]|nr:aspartate 1-decarboxylase [Deltaproteobacteria bacterium]